MSKKLSVLYVFFLIGLMPVLAVAAAKRDFYQIKVYHLKTEAQEKQMDEFLQRAYLPALHRAGIKDVGVFKPIATAEINPALKEKLIYVFIPFSSRDDFFILDSRLQKDRQYLEDGKLYIDAPYNDKPYERMEIILLNAFEKNPRYSLPKLNSPKKERIYELRSYEGHTEKISANKIRMFNQGDEVGLFKRLNFNAVFYGEVLAGSTMPNLMYLTTFENKADRDAHWNAFGKDAYWKELSGLAEYKNNVSKNVTTFLCPTDYSDI
jgi:hypothetical protein